MKSRPLGAGQSILASQNNDRRDDARGSSFLFAHQQLGALALGTVPTNGQVVPIVINGTTITVTAVTAIGSTANNVLIGGSALAFVTNLVNFLRRPDLTSATQVAASNANQTLLQYVGWAWPGSSTTVVPFSLNKNVNGIAGALTSFNITGITVTSGAWTAQTMQLHVQDGTYYINGTRYLFTGGSTPTVTAPSSHPRIDVLTIDTSGTLAWTTGAENVSPTAPTYPANKLAICELYNVVGETALYDNENQQAAQGYILNDVRPSVTAGPNLGAIPDDLLPDTTNTRSLGSSGNQWLNIYGENVFVNGNPIAGAKFGGTGADGAINVTSGTTTVNLGGAAVVIKNYTSINVSLGATLAFSNPNSNGTVIVLKSQGNVTIVGTVNASGMGAAGGASATGTGATNGNGNPGTAGAALFVKYGAGQGAVFSGSVPGAGGTAPAFILNMSSWTFAQIAKYPYIGIGAGAGSGDATNSGSTSWSTGVGGNGGPTLIIECAGALNFTGTISAAGQNGGNGVVVGGASSGAGGGGGGGGGFAAILYNILTSASGTLTVSGGTGGNVFCIGGAVRDGGGGGASFAGAGTVGTTSGTNGAQTGGNGATGASLLVQNTEFA